MSHPHPHVPDTPAQTSSRYRKQQHDHHGTACCNAAPIPAQPLPASQHRDGLQHTPIRILQMDCPTEEALIRKQLSGLSGVVELEFRLMQRLLTVTHQPAALPAILAALRSLGLPRSGRD
jgi:Cd2+/Zn2+-exporting ATPase